MKKILLLIIPLLLLTSCGYPTEGTLDGIKFKETDEVTNYIKIAMKDKSEVIIAELYPDIAPITVANFQKLVSEHFYDDLTFHRISASFVIQGGDPKGDGTGGSDQTIYGEFRRNGFTNNLKHERGVLSMARNGSNMDSASSQFFICLTTAKCSQLDDNYASFGKVIAGLNSVDKIAKTQVEEGTETPIKKPVIKSIRFVTIEK